MRLYRIKLFIIIVAAALLSTQFAEATELRDLPRVAMQAEANGNYSAALKCYLQIYDISPSIEIALKLSDLYVIMGQYDEAIQLLSDINAQGANKMLVDIHRASILFRKGFPSEALDILAQVADSDITPPEYRGIAYQNKAFIESSAGNYKNSLKSFQHALRFIEEEAERRNANANMALALAYSGEHARGLNLIDSVINLYKITLQQKHPDYQNCLRKKAEILLLGNNVCESYVHYSEYINREKEWVMDEFPNFNIQQRLNFWKSIKIHISEFFTIGDFSPYKSYDVALFKRQMTLLNNKMDELSANVNITTEDIQNSLAKYEAAVEFVTYRDFISCDTVYAACILTKDDCKFKKLGTKQELLSHKINGRTLKALLNNQSRANVNTLYRDTVLPKIIWDPIVEELGAEVRSVYFSPDGILNILGIENMPFRRSETLRPVRLSSTTRLTQRKSSQQAKWSSAVIGGLDYNASYKSENPNQEKVNGKEDVAIDKNGIKKLKFKYLPGTKKEIDSISFLTKAQCHYEMFEPQFYEALGKVTHLHIATHGYYHPIVREPYSPFSSISDMVVDNSMSMCGLALSGANVESELYDNLATSQELSQMNLTNLSLITLSACQTAVGDIDEEGCSGMVRGLKKAGAGSIMASLWKIDDEATAVFMSKFYSELEKKRTILSTYESTVRSIKNMEPEFEMKTVFNAATMTNELKKVEKINWNEPYFWAPFILIDAI